MYQDHYLTLFADEQEVKLYTEGDVKELYNYGIANDKPWTIVVDEDADMQDIENAMDLVSRV